MGRSTFSGPVKSTAGFIAGSDGTTITKILKGTVSVTPSALAAAAEEDLSVTVTGAVAGDIVIMTPPNAAMETGLGIQGCWVSAADTVKVRISNLNAVAALTGGAQTWAYCLIRS